MGYVKYMMDTNYFASNNHGDGGVRNMPFLLENYGVISNELFTLYNRC